MRMVGHAQHDSAAYVPREMLAYWKARDPLALYEKYLTGNGLLDDETKAATEARVKRELDEELAFAENAPFPQPESAEEGVYCRGCHAIEPQWQRSPEELLPPRASGTAAWIVKDFGDIQ